MSEEDWIRFGFIGLCIVLILGLLLCGLILTAPTAAAFTPTKDKPDCDAVSKTSILISWLGDSEGKVVIPSDPAKLADWVREVNQQWGTGLEIQGIRRIMKDGGLEWHSPDQGEYFQRPSGWQDPCPGPPWLMGLFYSVIPVVLLIGFLLLLRSLRVLKPQPI